MMTETETDVLRDYSVRFGRWLREDALPLWRREGFHGIEGGFSETIGLDGRATTANRRGRVHPRQIYCFAEAGARGWDGDWRPPVTEGLAYFDRVYHLPTGFYGALATADGVLVDDSFDLYNQAFAILAFAYTAKVLPETTPEMSARASAILSRLKSVYAHPQAGFEEAMPPKLPLCSNPHMHHFEAALACEAQAGFDQPAWAALADEIAGLAMTKFIDPTSGGIREFFRHDWSPMEGEKGRIMEPGHQFEWAWLLARWGKRRGNEEALARAHRLFGIGETYGICPDRKVAIMGLLDDFSVHDPVARFWAQTEWLKGAMRLAVLSEGEPRRHYLKSAVRAAGAMDIFLDVPVAGLWRDKMRPDGTFVEEAAPASTFYHILCAIYELQDCCDVLHIS